MSLHLSTSIHDTRHEAIAPQRAFSEETEDRERQHRKKAEKEDAPVYERKSQLSIHLKADTDTYPEREKRLSRHLRREEQSTEREEATEREKEGKKVEAVSLAT